MKLLEVLLKKNTVTLSIPVEHCNSSRIALGGSLRQQCSLIALQVQYSGSVGEKMYFGGRSGRSIRKKTEFLNPKREKKASQDSKQCDVKFVVFCKN